MRDDDFEPRLGRIRSKGDKRARRYLSRIAAAAALAGAGRKRSARRFDGSRIGRGASIGRVLGGRDQLARFRQRRAIVKTRLVRLGTKGFASARAHLRYIQRDGVTRDGAPGNLYAAEIDAADGGAFLDRGRNDRHQFRFIVSAEDGDQYDDLKPLTRRLMAQMESDLGTRLDWVAVDHFNTGHPHTHIMLRGVDDRGQNLIIAREYIAHGMRERLAELVTLDLGPQTVLEIEQRLRRDIIAERLTDIDRQLIRSMDAGGLVSTSGRDLARQAARAGRLQMLHKLGLAEPVGRNHWRLVEDLENKLRSMGERGDIVRTMQRELTRLRLYRDMAPSVRPEPIVGRLIARGLSDEHRDRRYLIVDAIDGRAHYVDVGLSDTIDLNEGAIVRLTHREAGARQADETIAEVAASQHGRYSPDLHLLHDRKASREFAHAHVRRLEALRRANIGIERANDGAWSIPPDFVERAANFEARKVRDQPVKIEIVSASPLHLLTIADGTTWLDRQLAGLEPTPPANGGFGREVRDALAARRNWLTEIGILDDATSDAPISGANLKSIERHGLKSIAARFEADLGKPFSPAEVGDRVEGKLVRKVQNAGAQFALVERSFDFTLVPWRSTLENQVGNEIGGVVTDAGINWRIGRSRSGPELS